MEGFDALLVANQQARVTAGSSDEAGNNLVNLLAKITSKETNKRFADLEIKGKDGKVHGIDFLASMEAEKAQGKNSIEAFMSIMDKVIGEDDKYKELQEKLKTADKAEQAVLLDQMTNLVQGTAIGQIISDRQALMALLGIRNNVQLGAAVKEQVTNAAGAVDKSHAVIADSNDYKLERLKNAAEFAQMNSMKGFNNMLGTVSDNLADYAAEYPKLATALAGAATGIAALGAAALAASGSLALLGGGRSSRGIPGMGGGTSGRRRGKGLPLGNAAKWGAVSLAAGLFTSPELDDNTRQTLDLKNKVESGKASEAEKDELDARIKREREAAKLHDAL